MHDHEWLDDETPEIKKKALQVGVSTLSRFVHSAGETFGASLAAATALHASKKQQSEPVFEAPANLMSVEPEVGQTAQ